MSLHPGMKSLPSPNNSLGAGDSLFQAIVGINTQKLSSPTSPVQIIRQRYWCKPPQRKPLDNCKETNNEKISRIKKRKNSIHASLEDLRNEFSHTKAIVRRQKSIPSESKVMELGRSEIVPRREKSQAARRVYEILMLNAWRKRKEDSAGLTNIVHYLTAELEKHKMQLTVAKSFVKQETKRNQTNTVQISILGRRLEEQIRIEQALAKDKAASQQLIAELEDKLSHEATLRSNVVNDLIEAKNEKAALESQLQKEREKLGKLREDMASATAKVSELQGILEAKSDSVVRLKKMNENQKGILLTMERRLAEEREKAKDQRELLIGEKTTLMRTISDLEGEKVELEGELRLRTEKEKECESRIESLEKDVATTEKRRENEREKALDMLCTILDERRTMELKSMLREQEMKFTATKFLCKLIRFPMNLLSSVTWIFLPKKNRCRIITNSSRR